jgi:pimeloyl-ACP methyl ester carboxylesterase
VERIDLWGISYGSHLALAAIDRIPAQIGRVVIASAEGLDQTVKRPARTRAYFRRLQAAVDAQPDARARYGDILAMMERVQTRLQAEPIMMEGGGEGGRAPLLFQLHHLQRMTGSMIADPGNAVWLLRLYEGLEAGETGMARYFARQSFSPGEPIRLRAMSTAMDVASGISTARLARFDAEASRSPAGRYLNFPMPQLDRVWPDVDLGPGFRDGPRGDTPVLLFTGTLDGRTYVEGQAEAVAGLSNVTRVIVRNAGHNLFMTSPDVGATMDAWLRGEPVPPEVVVEVPDLTGG